MKHSSICLTAGGGTGDDECICNTTPLVIYHKGCADGQGAAAAFYHLYPRSEFFAGVYSEEPPEVDGRDVYLVDFSYPRTTVVQMLEAARSVTIIDHHKTAIDALATLEHPALTKVLDNNYSGAVLTWKYMYPDKEVPQMLRHIQDRDLWRFDYPFTHQISAYLYSLEFHVHDWAAMLDTSWWDKNLSVMLAAGEALMRMDNHRVLGLVHNAHQLCIDSCLVGAVNTNHFHASDVGHELAKGKAFGATYYFDGSHWTFSLRSDSNGVDVSEVAKQYDGGGHFHAAGFRVNQEQFERFWK